MTAKKPKRVRKFLGKILLSLAKVLLWPVAGLLYLFGYILQGTVWVIRFVLHQFYRFKIYMGWEIR